MNKITIIEELKEYTNNPITYQKYKKLITNHIQSNKKEPLDLNSDLQLIHTGKSGYKLYLSNHLEREMINALQYEIQEELDNEILNKLIDHARQP
jgi:hypothetical protein